MCFNYPEISSLSEFLLKCIVDAPQLVDVKQELESMLCQKCAKTAEPPRKPNVTISKKATPNNTVLRDVMLHMVGNESVNLFVMIDHGETIFRITI